MKKTSSAIAVVCLTVLLFSSILALNVNTVKAAADITILSHSSYINSLGYLHVVGEVQNTGTIPLDFVEIIATFYNSSNDVVGSDFTFTYLDVIGVGEKSPFKILFLEETQVPKVDHYTLATDVDTTTALIPALNILSHSSYIDGLGNMHIIGEIENTGTETATWVMVVASLYNPEGMVVLVDFTFADPKDINSGNKAPFEILVLEEDRVPLVASYSLNAQSSEYCLVGALPTPEPPEASFSYMPLEPKVNETVSFDASGCSDSDGTIVSYLWDFGDEETSTNQNPTHAYTQSGYYSILLRVTDDDGLTDIEIAVIKVVMPDTPEPEPTPEPPIASFTYSPSNPQVNDTITFDSSSCSDADGTIVGYLWDFGDGDSSTTQNPTHAYDHEGSYTVTLTVTDNDGLTDTSTVSIAEVVIPEFPSFTLMLVAVTVVAVAGTIYKKKLKALTPPRNEKGG